MTVYQAQLLNKITTIPGEDVQSSLNSLAKTPEFKDVFNAEVTRRGLRPQDVISSLKGVYYKSSKQAHGNDRVITLRAKDHTDNELAAIVVILKVQKNWANGLKWREVKKVDEEREGEVT